MKSDDYECDYKIYFIVNWLYLFNYIFYVFCSYGLNGNKRNIKYVRMIGREGFNMVKTKKEQMCPEEVNEKFLTSSNCWSKLIEKVNKLDYKKQGERLWKLFLLDILLFFVFIFAICFFFSSLDW